MLGGFRRLSRGGLAQQALELGEDLFDRVQVRRAFWQEEELGPGCADELAHRFGFVTTEIVHDHDVAGAKRGGRGPSRHSSPPGSTTSLQRDIADGKPSELGYW